MPQSSSHNWNPAELIQLLERRTLDQAVPPSLPIWGSKIQTIPYVRVRGLANFWRTESTGPVNLEQCVEDLITGFHGQSLPFAYLVLANRKEAGIYFGLKGDPNDDLLAVALESAFPGIRLERKPVTDLGTRFEGTGVFSLVGRLTGIPTGKYGHPSSSTPSYDRQSPTQSSNPQIERLLRGLAGEDWGYLVWATPISDSEAIRASQERLSQLTQISAQIKSQENFQLTKSENVGPTSTVNESRSRTVDQTDRWAQHATDLLERDLRRHELGKAQGMWQTDVYFFAAKRPTLDKARALLRAIFAGADSTPEPIRTFIAEPNSGARDSFTTPLTSSEVATLCQLPREEFPGYQITDYARFDVDLPRTPDPDAIAIGKIVDQGRLTGDWFSLNRADFAKHSLIVGVTGSGKTNTVFHLLDKLWNRGNGIPFLVIEPAKTEYRDLLQRPAFKEMRIYTLGDERIAPFRLNPFEFEIGGTDQRIHIQTHIDFLKSVFNAAFILYAPMPYVLETCLHEIYQDKGWDLTTSLNRRLPPQQQGKENKWPVFPTLTDLYNKIEEVVNRLGYEERISRDVKAGLKARIGSLRLGGKGLMLDTRHGVPISDLLSHPAVLELERVGNDDEKAFLIGLILTRLYEYRIVQAKSGKARRAIRHVTVFEEAHRLLKNVKTDIGAEEANMKGQAVETFANMLSEIRAYGQGVLIAEQIPTKLAPDAIKNTNLKIMHRVVAADDREVMGGTMNLDEAQLRVITSLQSGQAAVYAEGADHSYLVEVVCQPEKDQAAQHTSDSEVTVAMSKHTIGDYYDPAPGYSQYLNLPASQETLTRDLALTVMAHPEFEEYFARYFLSLLLEPAQAVQGFRHLLKLIEREVGDLTPDTRRQVAIALLLHTLEALFDSQGRHYRWLYNVASTLRDQASAALVKIAQTFDNNVALLSRLEVQATSDLAPFIKGYRQQTQIRVGPFAGCEQCQARCLYRWHLTPLLHDKTLERDFTKAIQNTKDDQAMWAQLAQNARDAADRVLTVSPAANWQGVALCYAVQMCAVLNFSSASQKKLAKNVQTVLAKPPTQRKHE